MIGVAAPASAAKTIAVLEAPHTTRPGKRNRRMGLFVLVVTPLNLAFPIGRLVAGGAAGAVAFGPGCRAPSAGLLDRVRPAFPAGTELRGPAVVAAGDARVMAARAVVPSPFGPDGDPVAGDVLVYVDAPSQGFAFVDTQTPGVEVEGLVAGMPGMVATSSRSAEGWPSIFVSDPRPVARACSTRWAGEPDRTVRL